MKEEFDYRVERSGDGEKSWIPYSPLYDNFNLKELKKRLHEWNSTSPYCEKWRITKSPKQIWELVD